MERPSYVVRGRIRDDDVGATPVRIDDGVLAEDAAEGIILAAEKYDKALGCGSDAHSGIGLGYAYTILDQKVNKSTLNLALKKSKQKTNYLPVWQYGVPFLNRLKHYGFW